MKKSIIKTIAALLICLPLFTSCGNSSSDFEIKFSDTIPVAYVKEKYDFNKILIKEDGIKYSLAAAYFDYDSKVMKNLEVIDFTFVPQIKSDITVTVTATNATQLITRKTNLKVTAKGDPMDELLSIGASNFADDGVSKDLYLDEKYVKSGNSSINAKYYGNDYYRFGAAVIAPNNFRCLDYWTDKEWKNAIFTFWVYNPTDYDFEFQLRVKENSVDGGNVDIDWSDPKNTPQFAKPNQWTQIFFSMNRIGINRPLYVDESMEHNDSFIVKTRWLGTPGSVEEPISYSWNMFIDGVDVVDHTVYPEINTEPFESLEQGWENMALDTGWGVAKATISKEACHKAGYEKSTTGLELAFDGTTPKGDIAYALVISPEDEVKKGTIKELPDFSRGSIKADFKFSEDITNQNINFFAVKEGWVDGGTRRISDVTLSDLGDGWKRLEFGLDKVPQKFGDIGNTIRFGFSFNGINDSNKATAKIYVDNIFYDPEGDAPAPAYVRGEKIIAGQDASVRFSNPVTVASEAVINVDIKITSPGKVSIALMDDWGIAGHGYFGYYDFETGEETYTGVTKTILEDGYTRYSFKVKLLDKAAVSEGAPKIIDHIYVRGLSTTASGYIDASVA